MTAYLQEVLGEPVDDYETYNELANEYLNELVEKYKDEVKILINK